MNDAIQFIRSDDGARLAVTSGGTGTPLLYLPPFPFTHLEAGRKLDGQSRWFSRLSRHVTLGTFDCRGTGLSQRDAVDFSLDRIVRDVEAVAGALGWGSFALAGFFNAAPVALRFAALHPSRTTHVVLWGGFSKGTDVYPISLTPQSPDVVKTYWPLMITSAARLWTAEAEDSGDLARFFRLCVAPETALAAVTSARAYDVEADLDRVQAPTLVLSRPESVSQRRDLAPDLVRRLPEGKLMLMEGEAASPFAGDVERTVDVVVSS